MADTAEDKIPMDRLAKAYIRIRTKIQELTQDIEALKAEQDEIAGYMRDQMREMGTKSMRTEHGTISMSLKTRYSTNDWDSFKSFVVQHDVVDLLERRIAQANMARFLTENPDLVPPGLNSDSEYAISVRKPS
jgi:hypothetical protein